MFDYLSGPVYDFAMKLLASVFALFFAPLLAQASEVFKSEPTELDLELQRYIKTFKLKPTSPLGVEKNGLYEAGRELFADRVLSGNRNISCRDCHLPEKGLSDGLALSMGQGRPRGTPL